MTTILLPEPVAAYFDANRDMDAAAMAAPFADDAVVTDEAQTISGAAAIRDWIDRATVGNSAVAEPLSADTDGDTLVVACRVRGDFPGSPVPLTFRFVLRGDRIAALEIA